ncbi:hypothetical protein OU995_12080 [Roseateles sp. SL47]|uniref:hypothetical protein n=1 Tax=Roseateles sp. SL47 TaxID=2995138 RepID=UPI00226FDA2A|nr:hypothetical protein [Roseateles sp. SL47]WAC75386.1 hypothetical protein OU995_12080 [Roseateles sp. SL47]
MLMPLLSACVMYMPGDIGPRVSKLELGLNTGAVRDPALVSLVVAAKPDIVRTLLVLSDPRLNREEAERELGWNSKEPLMLLPEWRVSVGTLGTVRQGSTQRRPMAFMGAESWASPDKETIEFTALFSDGLQPELTVRERQTYRRDGRRWNLVKQER